METRSGPRGVERDDPALVDDSDAIAEPIDLLHRVAHEQDRHVLVLERRDALPDVSSRGWIEAGGELVEDEHTRPAGEGEGDRQPLLLPD